MRVFQVTFKTWDSSTMKEDSHTWRCTEDQVEGVKFSLRKRGITGYWKEIVPEGAPKPKSKAQLKREADAKRVLGQRLSLSLENFKDLYLKQSVKYEERMLANALANAKEELRQEKERDGSEYNIKWATRRVERIEAEIKRESTNHMNWLNTANKSYETKFEKLVAKLLAYGFTARLTVVSVYSEDPREFSFLVSENGREVHARTILAWGPIIRPHYRFITTERAA